MHFPTTSARLDKARERMKFEELYYLELHILRYSRKRNSKIAGRYFGRVGDCFNRFYFEVLPFQLTGAQKRVLHEIRADMKTGRQMNRLLQGDVGSGKTMVAFMTMLLAPDNGCQAALMAPTEILAHQHYDTLSEWAAAWTRHQAADRKHADCRAARDTCRTRFRQRGYDCGHARPD